MPVIGEPILEQPLKVGYDQISGFKFERTFEGLANLVLARAVDEIRNRCISFEFESRGLAARMTSRYGNVPVDGSAEQPTSQIQLRGQEVTQSIWKHPNFSPLPIAVQWAIIKAAQSTDSYAAAIAELIRTATDAGITDFTFVNAALALLTADDSGYIVAQSYVLTWTRTASRFYNPSINFSYDNTIFSTAGLAAWTGSALPFAIPNFPAVENTEALRLKYGWRKMETEFVDISNGNRQITEAWQSARWTGWLYNTA
jgi:hypothetical protein